MTTVTHAMATWDLAIRRLRETGYLATATLIDDATATAGFLDEVDVTMTLEQAAAVEATLVAWDAEVAAALEALENRRLEGDAFGVLIGRAY